MLPRDFCLQQQCLSVFDGEKVMEETDTVLNNKPSYTLYNDLNLFSTRIYEQIFSYMSSYRM